jgi:hypothetical protein
MSALGVPLELGPPYSSHIDFELYSNDGVYYLQSLFNGKPIVLPGEKNGICSFSRFVKIVEDSKPL